MSRTFAMLLLAGTLPAFAQDTSTTPSPTAPTFHTSGSPSLLSVSFSNLSSQSIHDGLDNNIPGSSVGTPYWNFAPGVQARYERSYRWWAGYFVNYGETNWKQVYSTQGLGNGVFQHASVPLQLHEISGAYLLKSRPLTFGIRPYAEFGAGALMFNPSQNPTGVLGDGAIAIGSTDHWRDLAMQTRFSGNAEVGATMDLRKHLGVRAAYRTLAYVAPNFHQGVAFGYKQYSIAQQPMLGIFVKF